MKRLLYMMIFFQMMMRLVAENLIVGDSSFETGTSKLVAGSMSGGVRWEIDSTTAAQGNSSLKVLFPTSGFTHSRIFPIKEGDYTFSFWAKSDAPNAKGWIGIWKPWSQSFTSPIVLTNRWKRYISSGFLKQGNAWLCLGSGTSGTIWVDAFQLEQGKTASEYSQHNPSVVGVSIKSDNDRIFYSGEKVPISIAADLKFSQTITLTITDAYGEIALKNEMLVKDEKYNDLISFKPPYNGLFYVKLEGEKKVAPATLTFAIVDKPAKLPPDTPPFLGIDGAGLLRSGISRIGGRWLEIPIRWSYIEKSQGKYNWNSLKLVETLYRKGYRIKAFFSSVPSWAWNEDEKKDATTRGVSTGHGGLLPSAKGMEAWKTFITEVCARYGKYISLFEIGAEDDLAWGRNPYYRAKYPQNIENTFVTGPFAKRLAEFYDEGIKQIRIGAPHAKIGLLRPSGSDCTSYNYSFSEAVLSQVTEPFDFFPIDPYLTPRYLGADMSKVAEVDNYLRDDLARADAMLKRIGKSVKIIISELGYAVSIKEQLTSHYYLESAKRMARSILISRAHPGMEMVQWYVIQAGTEGDKVQYNLWKSDNPVALVPAYSAVAGVVEGVISTKELAMGSAVTAIIYEKKNGASAAIWALGENGSIAFDDLALKQNIKSFLGRTLTPKKHSGKNIYPLTGFPIYIQSKSRSELEKIITSATLLFPPLDVSIDIPDINKASIKISNRVNKAININATITVNGIKKTIEPFTIAAFKQYAIETPLSGKAKINLKFNASAGDLYEDTEIKINEELIPIKKAPKNIIVDGKLDDWDGILATTKFRGRGDITPPDPSIAWNGNDDLSSDVLLAWDSKFLYIAAIVKDDNHFNKHIKDHIWAGDCMQIGLDVKGNANNNKRPGYDKDDWELGVALNPKEGKQFYVWYGKNRSSTKIISAVVRHENNKTTTYELAIPWNELGATGTAGKILGINYVVLDDDDGKGATYWNQLSAGIAGGKSPQKFKRFFLETGLPK